MTFTQDMQIFDEKEWEKLVEELSLPPRQSQIIQHLFQGKSDKQIAQDMGIALPTVRTHLGRLFEKFNTQDRSELILYIINYFRHGRETKAYHHKQLHHNY
ncbi:MAG: helix-turn-helix transcriptional regulator [Phycisphaerae bacterium]